MYSYDQGDFESQILITKAHFREWGQNFEDFD